MSSLDLLDYQVGLDAALAKPGPDGRPWLPANLRRQAVKDARNVVDAMAFRFALLDERPLPEDLDYLRALEAVKAPEAAAPVLARRRAHYARVRRRRMVTGWSSLALFVLLVVGVGYVATLEKTEDLALIDLVAAQESTVSRNATFVVDEATTRLHMDGTIILNRNSMGVIEVRLLDPEGRIRFEESYYPQGNIYLRENVYDPMPGAWVLLVDFNSARGSAYVDVDAVKPNR